MNSVVLESVSKVFRHRPALFNWLGRERRGETRALDVVSLSVPAGRVLVLLGPNGSGKTSILKLVSTMLLPDSGRVLVEGAESLLEPTDLESDLYSRIHMLFRQAWKRRVSLITPCSPPASW